jgi:hypothetical protein
VVSALAEASGLYSAEEEVLVPFGYSFLPPNDTTNWNHMRNTQLRGNSFLRTTLQRTLGTPPR